MSCEYKEPHHSLLYLMVFISMLGSCSGNRGRESTHTQILKRLSVIEQKINKKDVNEAFANISGAH